MSTQTFLVDGMTCGHCVGAVTAELTALVADATIDVVLAEAGPSTVTITGGAELTDHQVAEALDEAGGYTLHAASTA
jgi:copper chaperone CopZ